MAIPRLAFAGLGNVWSNLTSSHRLHAPSIFPSRTFIRSIPRLRTRNPLTKILSQWSIRRRGGILHLNNNTPFTIVFSIPSSIFSRSKTLQKCGALTLYAHVVYRPLFYPLMQIGSNLYRGGGDRIKRAGRGKAMVS